MVTDETSLDWRLLMQENIFKLNSSDVESAPAAASDTVVDVEDVESMPVEEEPRVNFGVV